MYQQEFRTWGRILFPKEVAEVRDCVFRVPDEEVLCLLAIVLLAVNIRENGGDLSVCKITRSADISNDMIGRHIPPSSFAITSALSSTV